MQILGIISDTHIPDKARALNPRVLEIFREAEVNAILHAGDISTPAVLAQLGAVAPVYAVKGNRDWVFLNHLPRERTFTFDGVTIGLAHGHGGVWRYFLGKLHYIREGYRIERFCAYLRATFPQASVIVFGHTHRPLNCHLDGVLFFNPGSACCIEDEKEYGPNIGLLHITGSQAHAETITLD